MRQLTGDTRIRIKGPLPLPRKRELTGDTRIRLSQIKDLAEWVEDQKYEIGQISTRTGLLKTAEGWVVPPHSMVPGPQEPIEKAHKIGGVAGSTQKTYHSLSAKKIKEHLLPTIKKTFSPERIKSLLNFQKKKKKVIVDTDKGPQTMEVPAAFLQNSDEQTIDSKEYQELTQDLPDQINYLHYYDFAGKTPKEASDSLQLMGFVNACAFKGRRQSELDAREKAINDIIYKKVKDVYVPKAVDYYVKNKARVSYDMAERLVYIHNPYTKVQVSFHYFDNPDNLDLEVPARDEWNHVENSYIFKDPEEMEKFKKIRNRIKEVLKDRKMLNDKEIGPIMNETGNKEMKYDILYEDKVWDQRTFKNDEEARKHLEHNREHGSMQIIKIINCKTDKEITL